MPMIPTGFDVKTQDALKQGFDKRGRYRIITTVPHSGTHSLMSMYGEDRHWHCDETVLEFVENNIDYIDVLTTYRKPERVAASWYNRNSQRNGTVSKPTEQGIRSRWKKYWGYYGDILKKAKNVEIFNMEDLGCRLYASADKLRLHSFLDDDKLDKFYDIVDKDLIKYAYKQINPHRRKI